MTICAPRTCVQNALLERHRNRAELQVLQFRAVGQQPLNELSFCFIVRARRREGVIQRLQIRTGCEEVSEINGRASAGQLKLAQRLRVVCDHGGHPGQEDAVNATDCEFAQATAVAQHCSEPSFCGRARFSRISRCAELNHGRLLEETGHDCAHRFRSRERGAKVLDSAERHHVMLHHLREAEGI